MKINWRIMICASKNFICISFVVCLVEVLYYNFGASHENKSWIRKYNRLRSNLRNSVSKRSRRAWRSHIQPKFIDSIHTMCYEPQINFSNFFNSWNYLLFWTLTLVTYPWIQVLTTNQKLLSIIEIHVLTTVKRVLY